MVKYTHHEANSRCQSGMVLASTQMRFFNVIPCSSGLHNIPCGKAKPYRCAPISAYLPTFSNFRFSSSRLRAWRPAPHAPKRSTCVDSLPRPLRPFDDDQAVLYGDKRMVPLSTDHGRGSQKEEDDDDDVRMMRMMRGIVGARLLWKLSW